MKKRFVSAIAMILVLTLLCPTTLCVSAEDVYLGTDEDITGEIVPDDADKTRDTGSDTVVDQMPGDGNPTIFSITAENVTTLLASRKSGKSFTRESLPSNAKRIIYEIQLNHSLADSLYMGDVIVAGVCYYGYSSQYQGNIYFSVHSSCVPLELLGVRYQTDFLISENLEYGTPYYSYVKNKYGDGYVYGTVTLYYSTSTG